MFGNLIPKQALNRSVKEHVIAKLLRLFHTLRHLRPRQVAYQLYYRATGKLTKNNAARTQVQKTVEALSPEPITFSFLNREVTFPSLSDIDWNYAPNGKLWTYNLNYFEFLESMSTEQGTALIDAWITKESTHQDGWEPYPLSLRIVSWIAFFIRTGQEPTEAVSACLRRQYQALWTKLEYHLGANHLLENALALTLASRYLADDKGHRRATSLLSAELKDQYLPDGAHYELSPMYHIILLDRMLTVYHCLSTSFEPAPRRPATANQPKITATLGQSLSEQLGWIMAFATEDGRYAQFNDGTAGIAPSVSAVLQRAAQLKLKPKPVSLSACGYRRWNSGPFDLWIDAAAIGPNDIPGHAHADSLTFELHLNGQPVIVDPAISTYEKNERRAWERATPAHNTVTVDERNSSDVWGGFRVGRRAVTTLERETKNSLTASHKGYGPVHRRTFNLIAEGLEITDELDPVETGTARFHFYQNITPSLTAEGCFLPDLSISWSNGEARIVPYERAVGWNELRPAWCLEVVFGSKVNFRFTTNL